jgi:hypothetical protein
MRRAFQLLAVLPLCCSLHGQGASGAVLRRLGQVDVRSLPRPAHPQGPLYSHNILLPDSELFRQEKLQAQGSRGGGGGGGGGGTPASNITGGSEEGLTAATSFDGLALSDTLGYIPPDTQIAAGTNSGALTLVEMVNATVLVTDGAGNVQAAGDLCGLFYCDFLTAVISDPIVRYDAATGHWFASVVTIEYVVQGALLVPEGQWRLAVSQTDDATGAWNVYGVTMSDGTFPDFPKLGFSADKVVQTGDSFTLSTNRYKGTEFAVLSKADVITGVATPGFQYFPPDQGMFAIQGISSSGQPLYMAAVGSSKSKTGVSVTTTDVPVAPFLTPPDAPQAGSTNLIATNGDWLVGSVLDESHQTMWVSGESACVPKGDTATRSCLRFVQLSLSGTKPALIQDLTFGVQGKYLYYPALALDPNGNMSAVYNVSSSSDYVGVYAGGQRFGSPSTFQSPVLLKAGEAPYDITPPRWGDYSGASSDPTPESLYNWLAGEYAQAANGGQWGTWISSVYFP